MDGWAFSLANNTYGFYWHSILLVFIRLQVNWSLTQQTMVERPPLTAAGKLQGTYKSTTIPTHIYSYGQTSLQWTKHALYLQCARKPEYQMRIHSSGEWENMQTPKGRRRDSNCEPQHSDACAHQYSILLITFNMAFKTYCLSIQAVFSVSHKLWPLKHFFKIVLY